MAAQLLGSVVLALFAQLPAEPAAEPPKETEKEFNTAPLVGIYKVVASEKNGIPTPAEKIDGMVVKFTADRIVVTDRDKSETYKARYKINAKPATMTITMVSEMEEHKGATVKGLIDVDDKLVKLIYMLPEGKVLPTEFKTQPGQIMVTLEKTYPPATARRPGETRR